MRDVTFLPGRSRLSFGSPFLSPLIFCLLPSPLALSALSFFCLWSILLTFVFTDNSTILVKNKTVRAVRLRLVRGRLFYALVEQLGAAIGMVWHDYLLLFICIMFLIVSVRSFKKKIKQILNNH